MVAAAHAVLCLCVVTDVSNAYEFSTHAALSREGFVRSQLYPGTSPDALSVHLVQQLGLGGNWANLGQYYFDVEKAGPVVRSAEPDPAAPFGANKIRSANFGSLYAPTLPSLAAWIMLGSIREDDVPYDIGEIDNTPQDEPGGPFTRVYNHFYNPLRDSALSMLGPMGSTAVQWAIDGTPYDVAYRRNNFSVRDAREAMWRALTLKLAPPQPYASGPLPAIGFAATEVIPSREALRIALWATTFRSIGNAVHLLQDMAQPQHTRDDWHAGLGCIAPICLGGHKSQYEALVEANTVRAASFTIRNRLLGRVGIDAVEVPVKPIVPVFGGYPIPAYPRYEDFFSEGIGGANATARGMANYSSRGFYSARTTPGNMGYRFATPPNDVASLTKVTIPVGQVLNANEQIVKGVSMELYSGAVVDTYSPAHSAPNVPLIARGAFDEFLRSYGKPQFVHTHHTYTAMQQLLIPRAVAYTAGFIDYFFRGRLEMSTPDEGVYAVRDATSPVCKDTCGFDKVKAKVKNTTPGETLGPGVMVAVAKFHRNACYQPDLSGEPGGPGFTGDICRVGEEEIVVSDAVAIGSLAANASTTMTFRFAAGTPIPINATDLSLQVVFRGKLGNEDDAVVVTTKDVAEPNLIAIHNSTDYAYASGGTYTAVPAASRETFANLSISFGAAVPPIVVATAPSLPAPGHAQVAVLADKGTLRMSMDLVPTKMALPHPLTFTALPMSESYLPAGGTGYGSTWEVERVRGMYRRFVHAIAWGPGPTVFMCSSDDPRTVCTESTLPALTPAQGRPLTIAF